MRAVCAVVLLLVATLMTARAEYAIGGSADVSIPVSVFRTNGKPLKSVRVYAVAGGQAGGNACFSGPGKYELEVPSARRFDIVFERRGWQRQVLVDLYGGEEQQIRKTLLHNDEVSSVLKKFLASYFVTLDQEKSEWDGVVDPC